MRIVKDFNVKKLRDYEEYEGGDIIKGLIEGRISTIVDLIMMGNNIEDREEACCLLDDYLEDGGSYLGIIEDIINVLMGGDTGKDTGEKTGYNDCGDKKYSDILKEYNKELMGYGIGYSEFWGMSIGDMYRVSESIIRKIEVEENRKLRDGYTQAVFIAQALCGKLPKEVPEVSISKRKENKREEGEDAVALENMLNAKAFALALKTKGEVRLHGE